MRRAILVTATAVLVSTPLLYFGLKPIYLVELSLQTVSENSARLLTPDRLYRTDGNSPLFFDLYAQIDEAESADIFLEIRPENVPKYYKQTEGIRVTNGRVSIVGQLGSVEFPLRSSESYSFRLVESSNQVRIEGRISATVQRIAGADRWIIIALGITASLVQILSVLWPERRGTRDDNRDGRQDP